MPFYVGFFIRCALPYVRRCIEIRFSGMKPVTERGEGFIQRLSRRPAFISNAFGSVRFCIYLSEKEVRGEKTGERKEMREIPPSRPPTIFSLSLWRRRTWGWRKPRAWLPGRETTKQPFTRRSSPWGIKAGRSDVNWGREVPKKVPEEGQCYQTMVDLLRKTA